MDAFITPRNDTVLFLKGQDFLTQITFDDKKNLKFNSLEA